MINVSEIRDLCIENNYFTKGSNSQYSTLFDFIEEGASIHDIALIIWICSLDADLKVIEDQVSRIIR